jgi:hypothetical protein
MADGRWGLVRKAGIASAAKRSMAALPALREAVGSVRAALASASRPTFRVVRG